MTYYRDDIRELVRRRLGDLTAPYKWSNEQVNQWINDAIADYSIHFPLLKTQTISCSEDDRQYDLSTDFVEVISVEYPTGEDPPVYLTRRDYKHPDFWEVEGYYDVLKHRDFENPDELIISEEPDEGESIDVIYQAHHTFLDDDDTDEMSVPERHLDLIILYVRMAAYQELATTESCDPNTNSIIAGTLELNAHRAERFYRKQLSEFKTAESESGKAKWTMDEYDRVY
ncbi:MAG: hypothetical protein ACK2TW_02310 [Anaerolineales bacterium]|jgi:hypothetical protein